MKDKLITFETSKLSYEKGFRFNTNPHYKYNGTIIRHGFQGCIITDFNCSRTSIVTQSLLQKWLREVHNISIWVSTGWYMSKFIYEVEISYIDKDGKFKEITPKLPNYSTMKYQDTYSDTYEEALEIGLQNGLKLIKI